MNKELEVQLRLECLKIAMELAKQKGADASDVIIDAQNLFKFVDGLEATLVDSKSFTTATLIFDIQGKSRGVLIEESENPSPEPFFKDVKDLAKGLASAIPGIDFKRYKIIIIQPDSLKYETSLYDFLNKKFEL